VVLSREERDRDNESLPFEFMDGVRTYLPLLKNLRYPILTSTQANNLIQAKKVKGFDVWSFITNSIIFFY